MALLVGQRGNRFHFLFDVTHTNKYVGGLNLGDLILLTAFFSSWTGANSLVLVLLYKSRNFPTQRFL